MKKPPGTETNPIHAVTVLSVSPANEDCLALEHIFESASDWAAYTTCRWRLIARRTLASALTSLQQHRIPIVLCERELITGFLAGYAGANRVAAQSACSDRD